MKGCREMAYGAILIGFASAISVLLTDGHIIHTIIYAASLPLKVMPKALAAVAMFYINLVFNFFVSSASGQAAIVMPIMTPLADVIGVTRQVAVPVSYTHLGKYFGVPCYELMGGKVRDKVKIYVNARARDAEGLAREAKKLVDQGFKSIRFSIGHPKDENNRCGESFTALVTRVEKSMKAVRETVGWDVDLSLIHISRACESTDTPNLPAQAAPKTISRQTG